MKTLNYLLFVYLILSFGCREIDTNPKPSNSNIRKKLVSLEYPTLDVFLDDVKKDQISFLDTEEEEFSSYGSMMDSLRSIVKSEELCSQKEALDFIHQNPLYYRSYLDENGELNVEERLRNSRLSNYLNANGEILIGNTRYMLSENDLRLIPITKIKSARFLTPNDLIIDHCLFQLDGDCDIIASGGNGSGNNSCGQYKDYPDDLGCPKGMGFTTYTNSDKRIKYRSFHVSSTCSVQFQVHAVAQNRFLRIWWDERRWLRGYAAEKVKYILWDGTYGEKLAQSSIIERYTSHFYIPVWVVPHSQCNSNGTHRCYDANDRHYEVDAYWFWIKDSSGAGTRIEECDKDQLCFDGRCPDPVTGYSPCKPCDSDEICIKGVCREIIF